MATQPSWKLHRGEVQIQSRASRLGQVAMLHLTPLVARQPSLSVPAARSAGSAMHLVQHGGRREVYKYKSPVRAVVPPPGKWVLRVPRRSFYNVPPRSLSRLRWPWTRRSALGNRPRNHRYHLYGPKGVRAVTG